MSKQVFLVLSCCQGQRRRLNDCRMRKMGVRGLLPPEITMNASGQNYIHVCIDT